MRIGFERQEKYQAELSKKYKAGNQDGDGGGRQKNLHASQRTNSDRVYGCGCALGFVLSDNTLTGLRLLKDRIKAQTADTPTCAEEDITATLFAPQPPTCYILPLPGPRLPIEKTFAGTFAFTSVN